MIGAAENAAPTADKLQKLTNQYLDSSAKLNKVNEQIKQAEKNRNATAEQMRKLKEAQEKLNKSLEVSQLSYRRTLENKKTREVFGPMRDACQGMAGNSSVGDEELVGKCRMFFEKSNELYSSIAYMGVPPVELPKWRYSSGKITPWEKGSVPPETGLSSSPKLPITQAPKWWVPEITNAGPVPGQE